MYINTYMRKNYVLVLGACTSLIHCACTHHWHYAEPLDTLAIRHRDTLTARISSILDHAAILPYS
jgi:hypothetical protein